MIEGGDILDGVKCYGRDDRLAAKAILVSAVITAFAIMFMIWVYSDMKKPDFYHQMRGTKGFIAGGFLLAGSVFVFLQNVLTVLAGGPQLTVSPQGISIKNIGKPRCLAWNELGSFGFIDKYNIAADILAQPGKKLKIPRMLLGDKIELCDTLNRHIAAAQGRDFSAMQGESRDELKKAEAADSQMKQASAALLRKGRWRLIILGAFFPAAFIAIAATKFLAVHFQMRMNLHQFWFLLAMFFILMMLCICFAVSTYIWPSDKSVD